MHTMETIPPTISDAQAHPPSSNPSTDTTTIPSITGAETRTADIDRIGQEVLRPSNTAQHQTIPPRAIELQRAASCSHVPRSQNAEQERPLEPIIVQHPPVGQEASAPGTTSAQVIPESSEEQYQRGRSYEFGPEEQRDLKKALELYHLASKQGHPEAQFHLGLMHERGIGTPPHRFQAVRWLYQAAAQGHREASQLYEQIIMQSAPDVQFSIAQFFERHSQKILISYNELIRIYALAARVGHIPALLSLGRLYHQGHGKREDVIRDIPLFQHFVDEGNTSVMIILSQIMDMRCIPDEETCRSQSIALCERAATMGDKEAQFIIGSNAEYGIGTGFSILPKAADMYNRAASQGHAESQCRLASMLHYGRGIPKNLVRARELYSLAIAQGHAIAALMLEQLDKEQKEAQESSSCTHAT